MTLIVGLVPPLFLGRQYWYRTGMRQDEVLFKIAERVKSKFGLQCSVLSATGDGTDICDQTSR